MGGHPYGRGAACPGRSPWTSRTGRCAGTTGPEVKAKKTILKVLQQFECFISVNSLGGGVHMACALSPFQSEPYKRAHKRMRGGTTATV